MNDFYVLLRDPRELETLGIEDDKYYSTTSARAKFHFEIFKSKKFQYEIVAPFIEWQKTTKFDMDRNG